MRWFDAVLRPELSDISAYRPAHADAGVARLDANESPYGLSDSARRHLADALARVDLHRYPDVRATKLREAIAEREQAHPEQIVIGCGSDEIIALIIGALSRPRAGKTQATVMFPDPSFVMFRVSALVNGARPVGVALDDAWDLDADAMVHAMDEHQPSVAACN